jgi:hypothetical protein
MPRERDEMSKKTSVKLSKKDRARIFQIANEYLLRIYEKTIGVLETAIRSGSTDMPLGLLSFLVYVDMLHGGAYACPIEQRPFFMPKGAASPYDAGAIQNADASTGLLGFLASVLGVTNAGPLVQQVMKDANCPHKFPKLISDEAYAAFLVILSTAATTDAFKSVGTGVKTFVEAAKIGAESVKTLAEAGKEAATIPKELLDALGVEDVKQLKALLSLA